MLYIFEDNEAVIKMIFKGRSPTMRHVSRTHRVALDSLFNGINLESKIQIKYVDTKNQLADILTEGNFTRDEWNHLLCLFNVSLFSSPSCVKAMSKRAQEGNGEERIAAKWKSERNLVPRRLAGYSTAQNSTESASPVNFTSENHELGLIAGTRQTVAEKRIQKPESNESDRKWNSQERQADARSTAGTGEPVAGNSIQMQDSSAAQSIA